MYFNTFLFQFGLDPDNFINEVIEPFESDDGKIIYNLRQRIDIRICPRCGCVDAEINNYSWTETNFTTNEGRPILIRIKKVRFKCQGCEKTYTPIIKGIERYSKISKQIETLIIRDFYKQKSFSIIGDGYHLTRSEIIKIFDRNVIHIRKGQLPAALCIDEIGFKTEDGNYAAIIYDHDKKIITDIIRNRQIDYLRSYFYSYSFKERSEVKYFISDLYDGYATIKKEFFKDAIHIADMFHVIRLLKTEVSKLRVNTYKQFTDETDIERHFMKQHWDYFEHYLDSKLANKAYYSKKEHFEYTTWSMMERCLKLNPTFWDAYSCLQDFYEYWRCKTFEQAIKHIESTSQKLKKTQYEDLMRVANTLLFWKSEIANAISVRYIDGKRYSNGPAEGLNSSIKTIIKDANGYKNFERFRKRALLILRDKKDLPH